jgi:hypothetical protein
MTEVPDDLVADAVDAWHEAPRNEHGHIALDDLMRFVLVAVLPTDRAAERAKVGEMLRDHAAGHRRTAERRGALEHELVRRAVALEAAADKITRGESR